MMSEYDQLRFRAAMYDAFGWPPPPYPWKSMHYWTVLALARMHPENAEPPIWKADE